MHILLGGRGPMAEAMKECCGRRGAHVTRYGSDFDYSNKDLGEPIGIYFGSPEKFPAYLSYCEEIPIPVILGSTKYDPFDTKKTIVMVVPNLSLRMMRALPLLIQLGVELKKGADVDIIEAHPERKKDISGTARAAAKGWDVSEEKIVVLRKRSEHLALGVPRKHREAFAYHRFIFSDNEGVEIELATRILSRDPYAEGALQLAQAFFERRGDEMLAPGKYGLADCSNLLLRKEK